MAPDDAPMTADLPVRAAAPVDYVRVCNSPVTLGDPGYFVIPGTETCLRIQGYVRAEYRFQERNTRGTLNTRPQNDVTFFARGRISMDARTPTDFGTLRSFVAIHAETLPSAGNNNELAYLDTGFIQFAGLTAGKINSFFDFFGFGNLMSSGALGSSDQLTEVLAYTAPFGAGWSATVSLENAVNRRVDSSGPFSYGGQSLPDLVANVNVTQAWGSAQVMGALHQVRHDGIRVPAAAAGVAANGVPFAAAAAVPHVGLDDELGFAIGAGVSINLPMIAAGDRLWLQATYADGALAYLGIAGNGEVRFSETTVFTSDAYYFAGPNSLRTASGWSLVGAFRHFWTPTLWSDIQGSYVAIDNPTGVAFAPDVDIWQVGTRLNWRPVTGITLAADVVYTAYEADALRPRVGGRTPVSSDSIWAGRLRIQRDF